MNYEDFDELVETVLNRTREVMESKNVEYAREGDKLSNFKRAGGLSLSSPEKALLGMLTKHIISVYDFVDDLDKDVDHPVETWEEKIGDSINYLILLEALMKERYS